MILDKFLKLFKKEETKEDPLLKEIENKGYEAKKEGDAYIVRRKGEYGMTIKECNSFAYLRKHGYELKREQGMLYIRPKEHYKK